MHFLKKYPLLRSPWFVLGIVLFGIDRSCKYWSMLGHSYLRGKPVAFWYFRNTGIAFSLPLSPVIFWPLAAVIFLLLAYLLIKSLRGNNAKAGLYLFVMLGALSNLIDRLLTGATTDYLIFFNRSAVNVADGMIILGLLLLTFGKSGGVVSPADGAKTES
jgi:lipoprotein signal peptidase